VGERGGERKRDSQWRKENERKGETSKVEKDGQMNEKDE